MKEERFFYVPNANEQTELPTEEATHALRVLRMKAGDEIHLIDGAGMFYRAQITLASKQHCDYKIEERIPQEKTWLGHIHLAIAPTKMMERMEWMAEKCTEIGFDELSFLECKWSERKQLRTDRIDKIVVSAVKQSRKAWKPVVHDMKAFNDFVSETVNGRKFIAHCYPELSRIDLYDELQKMPKDENITMLVGPEGDFSKEEVELAIANGYVPVTLGNSRLRTETAGLMAVTMAQLTKRR